VSGICVGKHSYSHVILQQGSGLYCRRARGGAPHQARQD
jgi:hypothetical protein